MSYFCTHVFHRTSWLLCPGKCSVGPRGPCEQASWDYSEIRYQIFNVLYSSSSRLCNLLGYLTMRQGINCGTNCILSSSHCTHAVQHSLLCTMQKLPRRKSLSSDFTAEDFALPGLKGANINHQHKI